MIRLRRKPDPMRHSYDVARLVALFAAKGCTVSEQDVQWAWSEYSEAHWSAGWMPLDSTDDPVAEMMPYLDEEPNHSDTPDPDRWRPAGEITRPGHYWMRKAENRAMRWIGRLSRVVGATGGRVMWEHEDFDGKYVGFLTGLEFAGPLTPPEDK